MSRQVLSRSRKQPSGGTLSEILQVAMIARENVEVIGRAALSRPSIDMTSELTLEALCHSRHFAIAPSCERLSTPGDRDAIACGPQRGRISSRAPVDATLSPEWRSPTNSRRHVAMSVWCNRLSVSFATWLETGKLSGDPDARERLRTSPGTQLRDGRARRMRTLDLEPNARRLSEKSRCWLSRHGSGRHARRRAALRPATKSSRWVPASALPGTRCAWCPATAIGAMPNQCTSLIETGRSPPERSTGGGA